LLTFEAKPYALLRVIMDIMRIYLDTRVTKIHANPIYKI
jgi:hypothetical protein